MPIISPAAARPAEGSRTCRGSRFSASNTATFRPTRLPACGGRPNGGRGVEQPRLPIPVGAHAVIECMGKIHVIAGYARHRVDGNFHQVFDFAPGAWSLKAPFPLPCNHVAGVSIGANIYTFGGFI